MIDFHCFAGRSQAAVSWPCLPWVGIQLRWMEMLWCSSIRRQAFQWPCPLMHYKWAHSHLPRDMWSTWDTAERCFLSSSKEQPISRGLASRKPRDAAVQTKELLQTSKEKLHSTVKASNTYFEIGPCFLFWLRYEKQSLIRSLICYYMLKISMSMKTKEPAWNFHCVSDFWKMSHDWVSCISSAFLSCAHSD